MALFELKADEEAISNAEALLAHVPFQVPIVLTRAINRAIKAARASGTKEARETYYIRSKDVRSAFTLSQASQSKLEASISASTGAAPLIKFRVSPKKANHRPKKGLSVGIRRDKGGGRLRSAFVQRMPSGHIGVFERTGASPHPIKQLYGPGIAQILSQRHILDGMSERAEEVLEKRIAHEVSRVLDRGKK